jgi:N-acetylmuramoyl-L-alanine amidase
VRRRLAPIHALLVLTGSLAAGLLLAQQAAMPPAAPVAPSASAPALPPGMPTLPITVTVAGADHAAVALQASAGPLFPLETLAPLLGGELRRGPGGVGWDLRVGESEAILAGGSAVATLGTTIVQLSQPVVGGADTSPFVPLDLLKKTFGEALHWDLAWDATTRRLTATPQQRRSVAVDWSLVHLQGISTLVLQFPEPPRLHVKENGQHLEVEVLGDQVTPTRPPEVNDALVQSLKFTNDRIVLDVAPGAVVEHYQQQDPFRLVFDIYQRVAQAAPTSPPASAPQRPTIVVDAGHGGVETGAIGPGGTQEKELTLLLAQALGRELQQKLPVNVELTRDEDAELPLDTRAAIANQHQAALFISIHLNSSVGTAAHGAETYFLSLEASDRKAAAVAATENSTPQPTPSPAGTAVPAAAAASSPDLKLILWDLAQSQHLVESQRFATLVQEELNTALGLRDRGVKQAPFRVLMGAAMPAVLVEVGFISNPDEEKKLLTPEYRQQLVDALVRAVARYQSLAAPPSPAAPPAPAAAATPAQPASKTP